MPFYIRNTVRHTTETPALLPRRYATIGLAEEDAKASNTKAQSMGVDAKYEAFEPESEDEAKAMEAITGARSPVRNEFDPSILDVDVNQLITSMGA